jgi:hypothetical protein
MVKYILVYLLIVLNSLSGNLWCQKITYGDPDRNDYRDLTFEIIGKTGENVLIFKFQRVKGEICAYDSDMKLVNKASCGFFPKDKVFNVDFVNYPEKSMLVYQYQKRNIVYCDAALVDSMGNIIGKAVTLDTVKIGFNASNKIFQFVKSDNKQHLAVVKTYRKNGATKFSVVRFNDKLEPIDKQYADFKWTEDEFSLAEYAINNNGCFAFLYNEVNSWRDDAVKRQVLYTNNINEVGFYNREILHNDYYVFDTRIKPDNVNNKWILTSSYANSKRGNIEGLQITIAPITNKKDSTYFFKHKFDEQLRKEGRGESSVKTAFNDYIQRNVIIKKDGGIIVISESYYSSGRDFNNNGNFNQWNSWNRYYWQQDFYSFDPYYNYFYQPFRSSSFGSVRRYHADNVVITNYSATGENLWNQVLSKKQFQDDNENFISFQPFLISGQILLLFNKLEQGDWLLYAHGISPEGVYTRYPTLKNLKRDSEFLIRLAKQTGNKTIIAPFKYRNYICFAKIEF